MTNKPRSAPVPKGAAPAPASAAPAPNPVPLMRRAVPEGGEPMGGGGAVKMLDRSAFATPAVLRFVRTDTFTAKKGMSAGKEGRIHVLRGAQGIDVGLFGSADLDHRIAKAREGDTLWLAYEGEQQHPDTPGRTLHVWSVARVAPERYALTSEYELGIPEDAPPHDDSDIGF